MNKHGKVQMVPLHCHSHFSLMDGVAKVEEYVDRAKDLGMPGIAITDHGTLTAHRQLYREAKSAGIKPIFGIEAYFTNDRFDKRKKDDRKSALDKIYNHLIIIAKNNVGYKNLNKLNEIAWTEGFHYKPRMDFDILDKYRDGLVVFSGCMGGMINQAIEQGELALAKNISAQFKEVIGNDFYIEVMPHNIQDMNRQLLELADSQNIPVIVTPDCHHATPDQKVIQEIMLIANTHPKIMKYGEGKDAIEATYEDSLKYDNQMDRLDYLYGEDRMLSFNKFDIHLLSGDEMWQAMGKDARPDMFENTFAVYNQVEDYDVPSNLNLLPTQYRNPSEVIYNRCKDSLTKLGVWSKEYEDRLNEELDIITEKKFEPYFLVVGNTIDFCREKNIMVGPGRGSGAGSLVCYAMGITSVDPIEHGLLFFRFINAGSSRWDSFYGFDAIK